MVLVPEVLHAVQGKVPVLAAGGIMTGRQMAGCMAMGSARTGSVWLATTEAQTSPVFRDKMIAARSRDTVRSRGRTGKPARQLRDRADGDPAHRAGSDVGADLEAEGVTIEGQAGVRVVMREEARVNGDVHAVRLAAAR